MGYKANQPSTGLGLHLANPKMWLQTQSCSRVATASQG